MRISASLATAPVCLIPSYLVQLERSPVEMLHFDIEDGAFVPGLSMGTKLVQDLRACSRLVFDVHLMVMQPERYILELAAMGADRLAVHWEVCPYPVRTLSLIKSAGIKAGLAFNPATPIPDLTFCLPWLDYVTVLTTEPTLGDSQLLPAVLEKIPESKSRYFSQELVWVVDGGITLENCQAVLDAGADILVVGRCLFLSGNLDGVLDKFEAFTQAKHAPKFGPTAVSKRI